MPPGDRPTSAAAGSWTLGARAEEPVASCEEKLRPRLLIEWRVVWTSETGMPSNVRVLVLSRRRPTFSSLGGVGGRLFTNTEVCMSSEEGKGMCERVG